MDKIDRSKYEHPAYSYKLLFAYFDKVDELVTSVHKIQMEAKNTKDE